MTVAAVAQQRFYKGAILFLDFCNDVVLVTHTMTYGTILFLDFRNDVVLVAHYDDVRHDSIFRLL